VEALLHQTFKPEFLNRIDEIVYFNPLSKEVQYQIVEKMLNELKGRLESNTTPSASPISSRLHPRFGLFAFLWRSPD
jgi:ATP-dependent Clp protease ATP-binding subunit ClpA